MEIFGVICFFAMLLGWMVLTLSTRRNSSLGAIIGLVLLLGGVIGCILSLFIIDENRQDSAIDRARRTTVVTGVITEEHQITLSGNSGSACKESIVLENSPYTFEAYCSLFVDEGFAHAPALDDVVKVTFIAPKQPGDKPEVLEVYNLTQESMRVRSVPPLPAETPID